MGVVVGVVLGAGVVTGEVVTGAPAEGEELPPPDTVDVPVDSVPVLAPEVGAVTAVEVVVVVAAAVVAACCGANGLRPRPASLESPGLVSTEIAGSAVPVEYGRPPVGCVT